MSVSEAFPLRLSIRTFIGSFHMTRPCHLPQAEQRGRYSLGKREMSENPALPRHSHGTYRWHPEGGRGNGPGPGPGGWLSRARGWTGRGPWRDPGDRASSHALCRRPIAPNPDPWSRANGTAALPNMRNMLDHRTDEGLRALIPRPRKPVAGGLYRVPTVVRG